MKRGLRRLRDRLLPAVAGKLAPYLLLFTAYGTLSLLWLAAIRGGVAGSAVLLVAAQAAMYLAYGGIALLLVGATRNMGTSLSLTGLYAGTSLAFSGATFPVQGAPLFAQVWSQLLPFTAYLKLQAQQLDLGAAWTASLSLLGTLLLFVLVAGGAGLRPAEVGQRGAGTTGVEGPGDVVEHRVERVADLAHLGPWVGVLLGHPLGEGDLAAAAAALGLGVDQEVGFPAYVGQVPPPETRTGAAAASNATR